MSESVPLGKQKQVVAATRGAGKTVGPKTGKTGVGNLSLRHALNFLHALFKLEALLIRVNENLPKEDINPQFPQIGEIKDLFAAACLLHRAYMKNESVPERRKAFRGALQALLNRPLEERQRYMKKARTVGDFAALWSTFEGHALAEMLEDGSGVEHLQPTFIAIYKQIYNGAVAMAFPGEQGFPKQLSGLYYANATACYQGVCELMRLVFDMACHEIEKEVDEALQASTLAGEQATQVREALDSERQALGMYYDAEKNEWQQASDDELLARVQAIAQGEGKPLTPEEAVEWLKRDTLKTQHISAGQAALGMGEEARKKLTTAVTLQQDGGEMHATINGVQAGALQGVPPPRHLKGGSGKKPEAGGSRGRGGRRGSTPRALPAPVAETSPQQSRPGGRGGYSHRQSRDQQQHQQGAGGSGYSPHHQQQTQYYGGYSQQQAYQQQQVHTYEQAYQNWLQYFRYSGPNPEEAYRSWLQYYNCSGLNPEQAYQQWYQQQFNGYSEAGPAGYPGQDGYGQHQTTQYYQQDYSPPSHPQQYSPPDHGGEACQQGQYYQGPPEDAANGGTYLQRRSPVQRPESPPVKEGAGYGPMTVSNKASPIGTSPLQQRREKKHPGQPSTHDHDDEEEAQEDDDGHKQAALLAAAATQAPATYLSGKAHWDAVSEGENDGQSDQDEDDDGYETESSSEEEEEEEGDE